MRPDPVLLLSLASLLPGCISAFLKNGDDAARSADYGYETPKAPWTPVDSGGGDAAWRNRDDGAVIGVNSVCGQEQDRSLVELTQHSLVGLGLGEAKRTGQQLTIDGKPALRSDLAGSLDGKPYTLVLTVVRAKRCVYDLTLARAGATAGHAEDYARLLATFHAEDGK